MLALLGIGLITVAGITMSKIDNSFSQAGSLAVIMFGFLVLFVGLLKVVDDRVEGHLAPHHFERPSIAATV